ncbi:MAG: YncE family protein [Candidatus Sericytochromatia bacterium]|nr:YncE family protein [Candidatus Sericytochromatia bacterium]
MHYYLLSALLCLNLSACQAPGTLPAQPSASTTPEAAAVIQTLQVGQTPHGITAAGDFVYNSNSGESTVSVIDARSDTLLPQIDLGEARPAYVKATADGQHVLLLDSTGQLHVIAAATQQILQSLPLGQGPDEMVLGSDAKVYVSLTGEAAVLQLDFAAGFDAVPQITRLNAGAPQADGGGHRSLTVGQQWLAVPNPGDNDLSLISLANGEMQRIQAGNDPGTVAIGGWDGQDQMLLIGNRASHTLTLHHLATGLAQTLTDAGQSPTEMLLVPELERAFVTMAGSNEVAVIQYRQQRLLGKVSVGQRPVHVYRAPALSKLTLQHEGHDHSAPEIWVGNDSGDSVSIIDAQTLAVLATVPVGKGHHKMAFAHNKAYVSNIADGTITVIDRQRLPYLQAE